jgi:hypothetical protein
MYTAFTLSNVFTAEKISINKRTVHTQHSTSYPNSDIIRKISTSKPDLKTGHRRRLFASKAVVGIIRKLSTQIDFYELYTVVCVFLLPSGFFPSSYRWCGLKTENRRFKKQLPLFGSDGFSVEIFRIYSLYNKNTDLDVTLLRFPKPYNYKLHRHTRILGFSRSRVQSSLHTHNIE